MHIIEMVLVELFELTAIIVLCVHNFLLSRWIIG